MKLVPLSRFWGKKEEEEPELSDELPEEAFQLPQEEQPTDSAETDSEEENEEEKGEENEEQSEGEEQEQGGGGDDQLLKVFQEVEDDYVDNSALVAGIEDVPVGELVEELRSLAAAFGLRSRRGEGDPGPTA
jgi:hypothetical protein